MDFAPIAFYALTGAATGNNGLWAPDQPFDPKNPVNPVALLITSLLSGAVSGWLTSMAFSKEGMLLGTLGAAVGSVLTVRAVKALGIFGK